MRCGAGCLPWRARCWRWVSSPPCRSAMPNKPRRARALPAGPKAPGAGRCGPSASIRRCRPRSATSRRGSTGPIRRSARGRSCSKPRCPQHRNIRVVVVATGLNQPWSMTWLPDGTMLVTERAGRLRVIRNGVLDPNPVAGVPEVRAQGLQGLMDVVLHPRFAENRYVYLSYHKPFPVPGATTPQGAPLVEGETVHRARHLERHGAHRRARHLSIGCHADRVVAHRLRARRHAAHDHQRVGHRSRRDALRGSQRLRRQDRAPARRRHHPARQPVRGQGRLQAGDLHARVIATAIRWRSTPRRASSGSRSRGPTAATRSTC